jgi:acetyl-CoA synthetase
MTATAVTLFPCFCIIRVRLLSLDAARCAVCAAQWDEDKVVESDFHSPSIRWFEGGETNLSVNCLDRHVSAGLAEKAALTFEGDCGSSREFTYAELLEEVCKMANVLRSNGVSKGDRVTLCMPMIPQLLVSVLACARIGAVHSVVFAGFSADAVADRIVNAGSSLVVTADAGQRGGKAVPLKEIVDVAVEVARHRGVDVPRVLVTRRGAMSTDAPPSALDELGSWVDGRDADLDALVAAAPSSCEAESMDAEDPLFILYTSGSTGKPKGVLHTTGGYMVYAGETFKHIFDHPGPEGASSCKDVHFCTADIGWITGHSYLTYGPLLNGAHSVMFEGVPTFPHPGRLWEVCEKHKVTTFYTAPTALRALMVHGDGPVKAHDLSSLRVLGTVGEPINPEAWTWYYDVVGGGKLPVIDTWWQTETGGVMITPLPGVTTLMPGSATKPFFGVKPVILHADGEVAGPNEAGHLTIGQAWPGMMRSVYGDHDRFKEAYFSQFPGYYTTGDGGRIDEEGNVWIMGRMDDVLNVSGHRLGTAEVESALGEHPLVVEAAVVGTAHPIKGQGIYCFVTLRADADVSDEEHLHKQLRDTVRASIGPIASPDAVHFTQDLPKTRSGKIMRRILRKIADGDTDEFGDTSTLADPSVITRLIAGRQSVH